MQLIANQRILDLSIPRVMGILNVTPDSFFDGGKYNRFVDAVDHAAKMIAAGAAIIDVGGESTRPGANIVSEEEEMDRVIPVVTALVKRFDIFISVDTSKALVMRESAAAGAHLINDIHALSDPGALDIITSSHLAVCLMHMQGEPRSMQQAPHYTNVFEEVQSYFVQRIALCEAHGIKRHRLLLDPGFGFGKTLTHNYHLLARLMDFHHFGLPLVVGMSHKSMIRELMDPSSETKEISGSIACAVIAAMQGAQIIRVHDVKQTIEALHVVQATLSEKKKKFL